MNRKRSLGLCNICVLVTAGAVVLASFFFPSPTELIGTGDAHGAQGKIPIVDKLDFSQVNFFVLTQPEFQERLTARALARLNKAGLVPANMNKRSKEIIATLTLTLDPIPSGDICPGKVMYDTKLQLHEEVVIPRNPEINIEVVTWSLAPGLPYLTSSVPIEKLEKDLDWYIDQFVIAYGVPNPRKK